MSVVDAESRRRLNDAYQLADVLSTVGVHSTEVAGLGELHWRLVATVAHVALPDSATVACVRARLVERERLATQAPNVGLPGGPGGAY